MNMDIASPYWPERPAPLMAVIAASQRTTCSAPYRPRAWELIDSPNGRR